MLLGHNGGARCDLRGNNINLHVWKCKSPPGNTLQLNWKSSSAVKTAAGNRKQISKRTLGQRLTLQTESKRINLKLLGYSPFCRFFKRLPQTTLSSIPANQRVYSHARSTATVDHPCNLEKCQACILSHEIFITWGGETKDLPFNFSLFCLNQTILAWQPGENWGLIQIGMEMNYSSVPLFLDWKKKLSPYGDESSANYHLNNSNTSCLKFRER